MCEAIAEAAKAEGRILAARRTDAFLAAQVVRANDDGVRCRGFEKALVDRALFFDAGRATPVRATEAERGAARR